MIEISSRYNPRETEDKWYKYWEEHKFFRGKANPAKEPFSIVIPPPNVTGILHMGHALNNTIQDILIRYNRMAGKEALWMPGVDHAGIATQNVVEKQIAKEGLKRQDLGREKFLERVWVWKEQYGSTIVSQLKKLGSSCDWDRMRFTMDEGYSDAVTEIFTKLYQEGLIYRGTYIINWCPRCQTALSDEEAPHKDLEGSLYYLKYPFKDDPDGFLTVATTRPETMLGDTAVAVNPKDKRYKKLIGKNLVLPLVEREIPVIADDMVDMKFGTGAVKVTPAHDPNDYAMGKKHHLEFVNVLRPDGRMNENSGEYADMDRFEARKAILEDLKEKGLLEKIEPHQLSAGHCYRCHTIIEPYLSKQWFVKMKPLAKEAIEVVKKNKIKFYPKRWTKVYLNWMENIQDWCISRQIWWGHRIPVYYCRKCEEKNVIVSKVKPDKCPVCGGTDIYQDEDVLDTWFSSWLWPFVTFGWPFQAQSLEQKARMEEELNYFYPTSALVTAPEILFFWVARMIMSGLHFMSDIPFKDVYLHGTVRDVEGRKMSKSLGNIIDPLEVINEFGADALRFSIISITAQGTDVYLSREKFEMGRNFANKIWNASRFVLMNLDDKQTSVDLCEYFKKEDLNIADRWILSRFYSTLDQVNKAIADFRFNEAATLLYGFFWHEFCDWYVEMAKLHIKDGSTQVVMNKVLEKSLRLLHPFMPFITEEIWQSLTAAQDKKSIMMQPWPHLQSQMCDKKLEARMGVIFDIIGSVRNMRAELQIPLDKKISIIISSSVKADRELIEGSVPYLKTLARLDEVRVVSAQKPLKSSVSLLVGDIHVFIPLEGVVDLDKERARIKAQIQGMENELKGKEVRLKNKEFVSKAPAEVVEKERSRVDEIKEQIAKLKRIQDEIK
ncbi:MAG: valine--tRNA ligase [Candidatus Omnitrophica bacterium]|nr:valine--tRNA ligase [Candidatus Omnitrophota bacterium]MDD5654168.1 valine--tRNA ligase [Candidatus Omnitrophota bacterium]